MDIFHRTGRYDNNSEKTNLLEPNKQKQLVWLYSSGLKILYLKINITLFFGKSLAKYSCLPLKLLLVNKIIIMHCLIYEYYSNKTIKMFLI